MKKKRIVVTGMGLVSCFGSDIDHFYAKLLAGDSGIAPITAFPCDEYPTRFAGAVQGFEVEGYMDKKQARRTDPFIRYAMVAGKRALESGSLGTTRDALSSLDLSRSGILIGSGMGGMSCFYEGVETLLTKGFKRLTPFFVPFIITNMGGALLAIDLGFMGPNYSISTACATSNYCIHAAAEHIRNGSADLMLCGGSEASINPIGLAGFVACNALSTRNEDPTKASRPWDMGRDGFVMGEGAGVLLLESLDHALARKTPIYAELLGSAVTCDAYHMTAPREDGLGVRTCMELALKDANIPKERVNYINAHATSTLAGDMCEIHAIQDLFKDQASQIKVNATKSMIGHCLGAAGGIEAIATIQAIRTGKLHPTINLEHPDPGLKNLDVIPNHPKSFQVDVALSNSFGFGGHNSSLAFAAYSP